MATIADALQNAADALNNAVTNVLSLRQSIADQLAAITTGTQTIINNFLNRPAVQSYYCDPINGNDANDGKTIDTPKKSFDAVVGLCATSSSQIYLMNDATLNNRYNIYASLFISGVQKTGTAPYYTPVTRTITFLGQATNSPVPGVGSFCSGFWCFGANVLSNNINYAMPDVPAGYDYRAHFSSAAGTTFNFTLGTVTVASANAGSLIGVTGSKSNVFFGLALGSGATGHLLAGVAAGANPNTLYAYTSNITAA